MFLYIVMSLAYLRFFYTLEQKRCSTLESRDLSFVPKPLVQEDSLVLKISQLLLKSFCPHDLNRVGQYP